MRSNWKPTFKIFAIPTPHWGQMRTENTFYKPCNATDKQLNAKLYQFLATHILHGSHIWQTVHFIRHLVLLRTCWKTNFTNFCSPYPSLEHYLTKKYIFKVILGYWESIECQLLQFFCGFHSSLGSGRTRKSILKDIQRYWEAIKSQISPACGRPTLNRSPIWPKSTFYKTFQANENQLTDEFYNY